MSKQYVDETIAVLSARGLRGGLTPEESYELCELVQARDRVIRRITARLRTVIEDAMDASHDADLLEAHGLALRLMPQEPRPSPAGAPTGVAGVLAAPPPRRTPGSTPTAPDFLIPPSRRGARTRGDS